MTKNTPNDLLIFNAALEISAPAERMAYINEACGADSDLREKILSLLAAYENEGDAFDSLAGMGATDVGARASESERPGSVIGRYKLLQQIGEGGMGVVYMAEQEEPVRRRVALKIIKLGMDTRQVVARFEAERQALALMDHPNIARVLDGGATEAGRPYFVMELVQGAPITEFCDKNQLSTEQRLKLFIPVCQAIQSAHQKGIIHRDLKPTNILVAVNPDGSGFPKIIDFGVAKATSQKLTEKTLFTSHGMMVGTPAYMSPEQAELSPLDVDTRADIYGLGALLYELLTGSAPFPDQRLRSAGYNEIQRIILHEEPERPSTRLSTLQGEQRSVVARNHGTSELSLGRSFPGDLDWIVMKCLEKDRARRYETANGLARDLERHLNNEPVSACSPSAAYRFQKFVRRNKMAVSAATAVALVLVLGVLVSGWEAVRATRMRKQAEANERTALAAQAKEAAQRRRAEEGERLGKRLFYAGKMSMAQLAWEQSRIGQLRQLLKDTADYPERGFEWYYWQRQTHLELKTLRGHLDVGAVAFSPDGRRIVTGSRDTTAKVWDAVSGNELLTLTGHLHEVTWVGFSTDGQRIVTGSFDATAKIWDAATGKELVTLQGHSGRIQSAALSPDNQRVVTGSADGTAKVWDAASAKQLLTLPGHTGRVHSAVFSPDGRRIVTSGDDHMARVWDAVSGQALLQIQAHSGVVWDAAFSPDGQRIVTAGDDLDPTAKVWDAATGKPLVILAGHGSGISTAVFSPDGQRVVTSSSDRTAKLWDAASGKELFTIKGHDDEVSDVAFSPDGLRIVTGSDDCTAKVWDATGNREVLGLKGHTVGILSVGFSADGKRIVTGSADQTARVWDAASGKQLLTLEGHSGAVRCVAFSPDGRWIATAYDRSAEIWEATTGTSLFALEGHNGPVNRLAFSPDSQRILTGGADRMAILWESSTRKQLHTFQGHGEGISGLAFSPDGRRIVTASADRTAKVWDLVSFKVLTTLQGHDGPIPCIAFSPDGQRILTGSNDRTARVWDANTGEQLLPPLVGHSAEVWSVAFSPDGRRLLTGSWDQTAKLWDAVTGVELLTLKDVDWVQSVAFSPDGRRILTGGGRGAATAKVWDAATPDQVANWEQEQKNADQHRAALSRRQAAADQQVRALTAQDPGAIKQWLVLGPLTFEPYSGAKALAKEQIADEAHLRPAAGQRSTVGGKDWEWTAVPLEDYRIDFRRIFRGIAPWRVAYLVCYIESDADRSDVSMRIGSEVQSKVYLNGKEIYRHDKPRKFVADQDVVTTGVELTAGLNVLVFKVVDEDDVWRASLRFTDAAGQPLKGIRVTLTPSS